MIKNEARAMLLREVADWCLMRLLEVPAACVVHRYAWEDGGRACTSANGRR